MIDFFHHVQTAALTDTGRVRKNNEDAFLSLPRDGFFAVADGMGGGSAGEVASRMVVESLAEHLEGSAEESPGERKCALLGALREANARVRSHAESNRFKSMGSTAVCLLLDPWNPARALLCHAGDSRAYCFRNAELFQLTTDHTVGESLKKQNLPETQFDQLLLRAVGTDKRLDPEWTETAVCPDDLFILCSDGLTRMVDDAAFAGLVGTADTPENTAAALVSAALENGGKDNVTVLLVKIANTLPPPLEVDELDRKESDLLMEVAERKT